MLGILVPSRGRPHNLERLVAAIRSTVAREYAVYTYIDDDDPSAGDYAPLAASDVNMTIGPRVFYAAAVNELAAIAVKDGCTYLAMFGDDVVPETVGWDEQLVDALDGRVGIAYGSDGLEHLHGPDLPTHFVTTAETYRRLGWVVLPTLRHLFADNVARELGRGVGNFRYLPDVKLPHLHRWNKAAPDDDTYREANDKRKRVLDRRAFEQWRDGPGYREAIAALS